MTNQEIIQKLKSLRIAYECALNYDAVPDESEAKALLDHILPKAIKVQEKALKEILKKYEGWSPSNVTESIIHLIDKLK